MPSPLHQIPQLPLILQTSSQHTWRPCYSLTSYDLRRVRKPLHVQSCLDCFRRHPAQTLSSFLLMVHRYNQRLLMSPKTTKLRPYFRCLAKISHCRCFPVPEPILQTKKPESGIDMLLDIFACFHNGCGKILNPSEISWIPVVLVSYVVVSSHKSNLPMNFLAGGTN